MRHTVQFHTYPDGDAEFMNKDEIVLRLTDRGSINDCYVGDLCDGDQYCQRLQTKLQKRTASDILNFIADREICISYEFGSDYEFIKLSDASGQSLTKYPYDNASALREAVEFVMDQEEL
jgi:hypothetical protein